MNGSTLTPPSALEIRNSKSEGPKGPEYAFNDV